MATLNIKGLPDDLYGKLRARAKREGRSVVQELIHLLSAALDGPSALSIMDLQGLGKDLWQGIDPVAHVSSERDAWD